jgi:hypothetical protein
MRTYGRIMADAAMRELGRVPSGAELKAQDTGQAISLDVILEAAFGVSDPERKAKFRRSIIELLRSSSGLLILLRPLQREFGGFGPFARFRRRKRAFDALVFEELAQRRQLGSDGPDILHMMMAARRGDGSAMSDDELRDQLFFLLLAGHETSAVSLAWALYELHRSPAALDRLRAEIDALGPDPAPDALATLPYLDAVCQETLRLHPLLGFVPRRLRQPFELRGYRLPAGVQVGVGIGLVHGREDLYPEPARFRPERFLEQVLAVRVPRVRRRDAALPGRGVRALRDEDRARDDPPPPSPDAARTRPGAPRPAQWIARRRDRDPDAARRTARIVAANQQRIERAARKLSGRRPDLASSGGGAIASIAAREQVDQRTDRAQEDEDEQPQGLVGLVSDAIEQHPDPDPGHQQDHTDDNELAQSRHADNVMGCAVTLQRESAPSPPNVPGAQNCAHTTEASWQVVSEAGYRQRFTCQSLFCSLRSASTLVESALKRSWRVVTVVIPPPAATPSDAAGSGNVLSQSI